MIEILLLSFLCKRMGANLRNKGWGTTVWMQIGVVVAWFGCMFAAAVGYGIFTVIASGPAAADKPNLLVLYPLCLGAAGMGVGLLFTIVRFFPSHDLPETWVITADSK
jgi:drug/metabolite transporter (DMT)-like permease